MVGGIAVVVLHGVRDRGGVTGEADIEILSGVQAGMEVVRGPSRVLKTLKDGMTVKRQTRSSGNSNANGGS